MGWMKMWYLSVTRRKLWHFAINSMDEVEHLDSKAQISLSKEIGWTEPHRAKLVRCVEIKKFLVKGYEIVPAIVQPFIVCSSYGLLLSQVFKIYNIKMILLKNITKSMSTNKWLYLIQNTYFMTLNLLNLNSFSFHWVHDQLKSSINIFLTYLKHIFLTHHKFIIL